MRASVLCLGLLAAATPASAENWTKDRVQIEGDRMVWSEVSLCHFEPDPPSSTEPRKFQIRTHAQVPRQGVISRDRFVELVTGIQFSFVLGLAEHSPGVKASQVFDRLRCEEIAEPIGAVDIDIKLTGTKDGYQVEVGDGKQISRATIKWNQ